MPGNLHRMTVLKILDAVPEAKTHGFMAALRKAAAAVDEDCEFPPDVRPIPDAYVIDAENGTVVLYEVEDKSRLADKKIADYCEIWWALDSIEWNGCLFTLDRFGVVTATIDLRELAMSRVLLEAARAGPPRPQDVAEMQEMMAQFQEIQEEQARAIDNNPAV